MPVLKAPKGGSTSCVNGQFYEGGQFIPDTGLYCGKKGQKRLEKVKKAKTRSRYFDLGGNALFEILKATKTSGIWDVLGIALANNNRDAERFAVSTFGPGCYVGKPI